MKSVYYYTCLFITYLLYSCFPPITDASERVLWVTRWDFNTAGDIEKIMQNCAYLGCSQVLFQVRGNATVYYQSKIEPWAWELTSDSPATMGQDPGWDPLAKALEEAKKHKMELHAWMNVMPGWRGIVPTPKGSTHPWVTHRSWFMIDHLGKLMRPSRSFYAFFSPGQPEFRNYCASVFGEIAREYPTLNGVHLDYIRYPGHTEVQGFRDFSYDVPSLSAFGKQYGKKPTFDMPEWQQFKCDQITETIRFISNAIRKESTTIQVSATFSGNIEAATSEKGQAPCDWLSNGLVDWIVPMVYEKNMGNLKETLAEIDQYIDSKWYKKMVIGLNVDTAFNNQAEVQRQVPYILNENKYGGEVLFAYAALFPNHTPNSRAKTIHLLWREDRVKELLTDRPVLITQ